VEHDTTNLSHRIDDGKLLDVRRLAGRNGITVSDEALGKIRQFVNLLRGWNERVNLISRRDVENIWEAHVLHSLGILFEWNIPEGWSVLDLGSGGGLPGIPISIVRPDLHITMLDATRKKMDAVNDMLAQLGLSGSRGVWGRAEDGSIRSRLGGSFDLVVARAVAPLPDLVKWSRPFVRPQRAGESTNPQLITLKGGDLQKEVDQVLQGGSVREVKVKALTFVGAETIPGIEKKIVSVYF